MPDDLAFDDPRPPTEDEWGTPLVEPRSAPEIEQKFRRRIGMVSGAVPYVTPHPWLYRPFLFLSDPVLDSIEKDYASALSFIIARDNSCRFCYSAHRTLLRLSNFSPTDLEDLERNFSAQGFTRREEWGLRLAVRLSRCEGVAEALDRLLHSGYSETAVREIAGISVLNLATNRTGTMLSIPVDTFEEMADRWYLRPWRSVAVPLLRLSRHWQNGQEVLQSGEAHGLLADWVRPLRGTPCGALLQIFLDQWLDEERPLSLQTKLLMLGVVARGVAATELKAHVQSVLVDRYELDATAVESTLNHLGGPAISDQGEPLLQLARSSIQYDFGPIKRVARECTRHLDRAGTLEVIASVSLANTVARLETLFPLDEDD